MLQKRGEVTRINVVRHTEDEPKTKKERKEDK